MKIVLAEWSNFSYRQLNRPVAAVVASTRCIIHQLVRDFRNRDVLSMCAALSLTGNLQRGVVTAHGAQLIVRLAPVHARVAVASRMHHLQTIRERKGEEVNGWTISLGKTHDCKVHAIA